MVLKKVTSWTLITFFGVFFTVFLGYFSNYVFPWQRQEAIKSAIEIGGLSELPNDIKSLQIEKRGNIFTRQFIIEFDSNELEIREWIEKSKRLKDIEPKRKGNKTIYAVYPGENGAYGGNVIIEDNKVYIKMSWS